MYFGLFLMHCLINLCLCLKNSEFIVSSGNAVGVATETLKRHLGLYCDLKLQSPLLLLCLFLQTSPLPYLSACFPLWLLS